jgi:hypothetical protein
MSEQDRQIARRFADALFYNSAISLALIGAIFLAFPVFIDLSGMDLIFWPLFALSFFAVIGFTIYLAFEAVLFRMIASYNDLASALKAIDAFLRRSGLRPDTRENRSFTDRLAGTQRLLNFQRAALFLFLALFAALVAL